MNPTVEIEYRSLITEDDFLRLRKFLGENAKLLGEDNKDTVFYIWPDKVIKVANNESTGKAKIALKPGRMYKQAFFHETELTVLPDEVEKAKQFCKGLEPEKVMEAYQFRTNYLFKGVEIALKYTESFGFHLEFEIMVDDVAKKEEAENVIRSAAEELGVSILTDQQLAVVTVELEGGIKYGQYSREDFPH